MFSYFVSFNVSHFRSIFILFFWIMLFTTCSVGSTLYYIM